jgi:hypothetical protein
VTNLTVNGSSTNFTMASGDTIDWSYNLPVGGTAAIQIWIDVNSNTIIDPATDVLWQAFMQIDGQQGLDGPPDMDGAVDGHISFAMNIGLAPAMYIMSFKNDNAGLEVYGTVTPLSSPVYTISGNISPAKENVVVSLENNDDNGTFWNGISDASGNFVIKMGSDTTGNPWRVVIDNTYLFGSSVISPNEYLITISPGTLIYPNKNFMVTPAAADISGTLKDENGNSIIGGYVWINGNNGIIDRNTGTDITGTYKLGFLSSELPATNVFVGAFDSWDTTIVSPGYLFPTVNSGNQLVRDLIVFRTNSTITGRVTINGSAPNDNIELLAQNADTGFVFTLSNTNGDFIFHVTDKIFNYTIRSSNLGAYNFNSVLAHPGETNVILNLTLTDIVQDESLVPKEYSLSQNYPNPFNPSTRIQYALSDKQFVQLKVFDVLGNEVATLINEEKATGNYSVDFNASNLPGGKAGLPSGVYLYKIQAGSFVETKKMILLK